MPRYLAMASSISMGAMTFVSIFTMFNGMGKDYSLFDNVVSILMIVTMIASMVILPIFIFKWEKKRDKKYERMRQIKYKRYLKEKLIEIEHKNGLVSVYQSLSEVSVKKGDIVTSGQIIGKSGTNELDKEIGNHLHFELYKDSQSVDPIKYINKEIEEN